MRVHLSGLVDILRPIPDASYTRDRTTSPPNSHCYPHTRRPVVDKLKSWAQESMLQNSRCHVKWLYGHVGCGKSAIAQTVAEELAGLGGLGGSFFFFRSAGDRSRIARLPVTLAYQLSLSVPTTARIIRRVVDDDPTLLMPESHSLQVRMRRLVYEPIRAVPITRSPYLIVIDGLDECVDHDEVEEFVAGLLSFFDSNPTVPLRFLIVSRLEQHIHRHLQNESVSLENLVDHAADEDIEMFLRSVFAKEVETNRVIRSYGEWPTEEQFQRLVQHVDGSFIFASTFAKYILGQFEDDVRLDESPFRRLMRTVRNGRSDGSTPVERLRSVLEIAPGLDGLYTQILARAEHLPFFLQIILCLGMALYPFWSIKDLADAHSCDAFQITNTLVHLHAIIQVPSDDHTVITFFHTSLGEFLKDDRRSGRFSMDSITRKLFHSANIPSLTRILTVIALWAHPDSLRHTLESLAFIAEAQTAEFRQFCYQFPAFVDVYATHEPFTENVYEVIIGNRDLHDFLLDPKRSMEFHVSLNDLCKAAIRRAKTLPHFTDALTTLMILCPWHRTARRIARHAMVSGLHHYAVDIIIRYLQPIVFVPGPLPRTCDPEVILFAHDMEDVFNTELDFTLSINSKCRAALARSAQFPHFREIISMLMVCPHWENLPIDSLVNILGIGKRQILNVLRGLQPLVSLDEGERSAFIEYEHFNRFITDRRLSQEVYTTPDEFLTQRLTQIERLPYGRVVLLELMSRFGRWEAESPARFAEAIGKPPSDVLNVLNCLFPLCKDFDFDPVTQTSYTIQCHKELIAFLFDKGRSGGFYIELTMEERKEVDRTLSLPNGSRGYVVPFDWDYV